MNPSWDSLPLAEGATLRNYDVDAWCTGNGTQAEQHSNVVDQDRIFTLVDTMTVTPFRVVYPPSVVLICGHEEEMTRAFLCPYDYKTQTFHRETVSRLPTKVLDRMDQVERFRFPMDSRPLMLN
jgi:hypothetical protein